MPVYSFDTQHAEKHGLNEAVLIHNLIFWISKNRANEKHFYEGRTWTYNSHEAMKVLFPFWSKDQIRRILKSLEKQDVIIKGNFNPNGYNQTLWYAFKNEAEILGESQLAKSPHRSGEIAASKERNHHIEAAKSPHPKSKPNSKPNSKPFILSEAQKFYYLDSKKKRGESLTKAEQQAFDDILAREFADANPPAAAVIITEGEACEPCNTALTQTWRKPAAKLRHDVGESTFNSWLKPLRIAIHTETQNPVLVAPTRFIKQFIDNHYTRDIDSAWKFFNPLLPTPQIIHGRLN